MYDCDTNTMRMQKRRCTDMKNNRRVTLPQARPAAEEALLETRKMVWDKTASDYMKENCDNKGRQKVCNLTAQQMISMKKLKKRITVER